MKTPVKFKPFERVLVYADAYRIWHCDLYSHYDSKKKKHATIFGLYEHCVPYIGNEHLLNTSIGIEDD